MSKENEGTVAKKVAQAVIDASSIFSTDKKTCYMERARREKNNLAEWTISQILENAEIAEKNHSPLCDDTGIPHLLLEVGKGRAITGSLLAQIDAGVREGLRKLPGRPMAVLGNEQERLEQSMGLDDRSEAVLYAPLQVLPVSEEDTLRLTVLMQGGGPEIRAKTYRVFHHHDKNTVLQEIITWASDAVAMLGCSPCTIAIGIGRSHYEASALMLQAMAEGDYQCQNDMEKEITSALNEIGVGALGLGGSTSVLATFMKIGPQRASGVRIVCMRPCCCFEPRRASVDL